MKTYRDLSFAQVQEFADKNELNIDSSENYREAAIALFDLEEKIKGIAEDQHTPGPWLLSGQLKCLDGGFVPAIVQAGNKLIAEINFNTKINLGSGEATANAQLIASAPELLEALKEVIKNAPDQFHIPTWDLVLSAINKATGK